MIIDFIEMAADFVIGIWRKDSDLRDSSVFGESEIEKKERKAVGWVCFGIFVLLVAVGIGCWWWIQNKQ